MKTAYVDLDDIEGFEGLSVTEKYNRAIRRIAKGHRLRILLRRKKSAEPPHWETQSVISCPARYKGQNPFYSLVSHLTIRYDKVLKQGLNAYAEDIAKRLKDTSLSEEEILFLHSLENVIESIRIWHAQISNGYGKPQTGSSQAFAPGPPFSPARNFHKASAIPVVYFRFCAFMRQSAGDRPVGAGGGGLSGKRPAKRPADGK